MRSGKWEVVILLDEITWLSHNDPTFLPKLKNAWDNFFKKNSELMLIVCGSISAWIDKNIFDGLMNLIAAITAAISSLIKGLQSGRVQNYAVYFFAGVVGFALVFIYLWK